MKDPPKIHLDAGGSGNKNVITVVAGNKLRFDVEVTGEPAPVVCWMKGDQVSLAVCRSPEQGGRRSVRRFKEKQTLVSVIGGV